MSTETDQLAHVVVGDPDPEPDGPADCPAKSEPMPHAPYLCTRTNGHPGQHIAVGRSVLAVWSVAATSDGGENS